MSNRNRNHNRNLKRKYIYVQENEKNRKGGEPIGSPLNFCLQYLL